MATKTARATAVLVLSLLILVGCEGRDSLSDEVDGGLEVDAGLVVDAAGAEAWPGTCDPVRQDCPVGLQCTAGCNVVTVMAKVFTCATPTATAAATHGQDCGTGCAPGHDCFAVLDATGVARNVCRKYCNTNTDCPNGNCAAEGVVCTADDMTPIGRLCGL